MSSGHRILNICHGHPDFNRGGAEVAAYNLHLAYRAQQTVESSVFLARHDRGRGVTGSIALIRPDEYLWEQSISDWFRLSTAHSQGLLLGFREFLHAYKPTLVHVHHYIHFGIEMLQLIRNACPNAKIIMTLHEYIAICANQGQMIKTRTHQLCNRESLEDCVMCFPERTQEEFWLRKHRLQSYLRVVDHFVSPSEFLRQRYVSWGISAEKISVIENCHPASMTLPPRPITRGGRRNRFGFFGQVTPFKGLELLLKAVASLKKHEQLELVIEINGANLDKQEIELQDRIRSLLQPLEKQGSVQLRGPYEHDAMSRRIALVDWVVVPSIWWENSPMVIQEAFAYGRPVVCADIGGMAEKVRDGIDGIHVQSGSVAAWADALRRLSSDDSTIWDQLCSGIKRPEPEAKVVESHLRLISSSENSGAM